ncbi:MAG: acyl carrier protein [Mogibacterium sp.]|nr:acyl carrier protein [Mogibacterium sp.]MBQ9075761.1 acyl carrier protein [Mogibacterium sp.]
MEQLMEILEGLRPDIDFANEKSLVTDRLLESFDIINLVSEIDDEFDVKIKPADLVPENFDSAEAMWELIQRLQDEEF